MAENLVVVVALVLGWNQGEASLGGGGELEKLNRRETQKYKVTEF